MATRSASAGRSRSRFRARTSTGEIEVHLQPIVDIATGRIEAVEALARWTSPVLGSVRPDIFIPIAERTGQIHRLTLLLLRKALACLERLPPSVKLSFNLSANDIASAETVLAITAAIRASGLDPARIVLELTETAVLRDFQAAENSLQLFHRLGARIALDDFGTGQSSLSYLRRLPIDRVKLDRSFVAGASDASGRRLLSAIVGLCASLEMRCIAEGVETEAQRLFLTESGCNAYQGYLFARPMPVDDLMRLTEPSADPVAA